MDEKKYLSEVISTRIIDDLSNLGVNTHELLPKSRSAKELEENLLSETLTIFRTPFDSLNNFLTEKFDGIGIPEFMQIYTKLHVGQSFCLPVATPEITCYFKTERDHDYLAQFLPQYQESIVPNPFSFQGSRLNLHNDTIYKFTLIHANFSLAEFADYFRCGYHYETNEFHFFIKSSIQFDLTVVYEEKH